MTDMSEVILKAARRGRLRYAPEQKQALIEACETSGTAEEELNIGLDPGGGAAVRR